MSTHLNRLAGTDGNGVFIIERVDGNFRLTEACDYNFYEVFTPEELRQLGLELIAMADSAVNK